MTTCRKEPSRGLSETGATLIEVMIALALTGIIALTIMKTYSIQHETQMAQNDVVVMQQKARSAIDELSRQIRMAGRAIPAGLQPIIPSNTDPDTITLVYMGEDCQTFLSAKMPTTSAELKCGGDISCFNEDQWAYIWDPDSAAGEWFQISEVQEAAKHLQHRFNPKDLSRQYDANAVILALERVKFYVDKTTNNLMIQIGSDAPAPYAESIIDLQFQYRLSGGAIVDVPVLISDVREVLISVTARTARSMYSDRSDDGGDYDFPTRTYRTSACLRNN